MAIISFISAMARVEKASVKERSTSGPFISMEPAITIKALTILMEARPVTWDL